MAVDKYSQTPASNYLAPYAFTGMAPSLVKVAVSNVMADVCQQLIGLPTSGGTANAQTITNTDQIATLVAGYGQWFIAGATSTGAVTFAIDGTAAKNGFIAGQGIALLGGMIISGQAYYLKYDGTQYQVYGASRVTGSFTGQLTGVASGGSGTVNYAIGIDGKTVTVWFANSITATSNSTSMTMTGIPAAIQPATNKYFQIRLTDAAGSSGGAVSLAASSGTWTFAFVYGTASGGFTGSGTKGINSLGTGFTYTLD